MKNLKFLFLGTSLSCLPGLAFGQCVVTEDCAALGYTESSCDGGKGVKCPFGSGWFCAGDEASICVENGFKYSCTGTGYAGGAGSACGGKYIQCTCASGYEWKNGSCQKKGQDYSLCKVGTLFYSDGTCLSDKLSGKELLGVVVYEKTASESGWVMTVEPVATNIAWDNAGSYYSTGVTDKAASASCTNTKKLVALGSRFAAANKANSYKAGGKKWCLPSYGVLNNINNSTNFTKVNAGITTAGGTILGNVYNGNENVWLLSEYSSTDAWEFHAETSGNFRMDSNPKDAVRADSVRPVLAF